MFTAFNPSMFLNIYSSQHTALICFFSIKNSLQPLKIHYDTDAVSIF